MGIELDTDNSNLRGRDLTHPDLGQDARISFRFCQGVRDEDVFLDCRVPVQPHASAEAPGTQPPTLQDIPVVRRVRFHA